MYEVETMKSNDQKNYGISAVKVMNGRAINDQFCIPGTRKSNAYQFRLQHILPSLAVNEATRS